MSPVLLLLPLLLILLIVVAVARATPRVHCITGHVVGARCVCSPEAWQPGVRRSTDWLYATFGGARCHWQDVCDRQLCSSRGGECHGARCLFDADHTGDGERCMPVADDLPHVPESDVQTATQIRSTARSALKHLPRPVQSRAIALALESSANAAECRHTSRPIRIAYAITIHDTRSARVTAAALREKSTGLAQLALMLVSQFVVAVFPCCLLCMLIVLIRSKLYGDPMMFSLCTLNRALRVPTLGKCDDWQLATTMCLL